MRSTRFPGRLFVALAIGTTTAISSGIYAPAFATATGRSAATSKPASGLPAYGNPNGHDYVPPAGRAVSSSHPNHVIGNGNPASCTSNAVVRTVAEGGVIT